MKKKLQLNNPSLHLKNIIIKSDHLILRPITRNDASEIFKEFTGEITRYMLPKPAEKIEETLEFIQQSERNMAACNELILVILTRKTNEFIGICGLQGRDNIAIPELGIWIKKNQQGKKNGREAIEALVEWAEKNLQYEYLVYPVDKDNIPSRKIPESLGGQIFKSAKIKTMRDTYLNTVIYKIEPRTGTIVEK